MSGVHDDFADLLVDLLNERGDKGSGNTGQLTAESFLALTRRASVEDRDCIASALPPWAQRQLGMWGD